MRRFTALSRVIVVQSMSPSRLGRGTTFEIYFPLWAGEDEEALPGGATGSEDLGVVGA